MSPTPKPLEPVADKIRALLAKTVENGCTEAEAQSAAAMAQKMMAKYQIDEALLASLGSVNEIGITEENIFTASSAKWHWVVSFANEVAEINGCKLYYREPREYRKVYGKWAWAATGERNIFIVGPKSSVDFVRDILDQLVWWIDKESVKEMKVAKAAHDPFFDGKWNGSQWRQGFYYGAWTRICSRMRSMRNEEIAEAQSSNEAVGTALAIVKSAVDKYMDENHNNLREGNSSSRKLDWNGVRRGRAAGDRVDVTGGLNESTERAGIGA